LARRGEVFHAQPTDDDLRARKAGATGDVRGRCARPVVRAGWPADHSVPGERGHHRRARPGASAGREDRDRRRNPRPRRGRGGTDFAIGRLNPDGTPDTTFGGGDGVVVFRDPGNADSATGVALQADGKIVASGTFTHNNDQDVPDYSLFAALRFNPDGTADATWGTDGVAVTVLGDPESVPFDAAGDVVIDPAGRVIVIGGRTNAVTGATDIALVAHDPANGSLDPTYGDGGKVFARVRHESETGADGVLQPDGKLLITGVAFDLPAPDAEAFTTTFLTARFNANGALDTAFGEGGAAYTDFSGRSGAPVQFAASDAIALQPDGKILVGGLVARGGRVGARQVPGGAGAAESGRLAGPDVRQAGEGRVQPRPAHVGQPDPGPGRRAGSFAPAWRRRRSPGCPPAASAPWWSSTTRRATWTRRSAPVAG
jgi:uncharacterized delta-60 repeat protein